VGLALGCEASPTMFLWMSKARKICVESTTKHCQQKVASLSVILLEAVLDQYQFKVNQERRKPIIFVSWSVRQLAAHVKMFAQSRSG
jgi:hemolysin-activating ACP:hemolysin acyltransferase